MNILSLIVGRDGCSGYRVRNPLGKIEKAKDEHQVFFVNHGDSGEQLVDLISGANVIVFRQQHDKMFQYLKNQKEIDVSKKLFVVDMDDDIFNITPFADTYRWGGVEEVQYEGKWLWKNGENNFDARRNANALSSIVDMLSQADLITCTTPYLKKRLIDISGNDKVEVLPNAIDFTHWRKWPLKKHKEIRIGWTGGATHYIDWYTIKNGLKRVFDKYGNIKLVLQGCKWDGTIKGIPHEFHDWIDFDGHPYKTASLDIDIAIIPLKDTLFNKSKSCIKWYEFSALGIPCLVSDVLPYSGEIKNGDTALSFKTEDEFVDQLSLLIEHRALRDRIGANAKKWVKEHRNIDKIKDDYIKVYAKYMEEKFSNFTVKNFEKIKFVGVADIKEPEQYLNKSDEILKKHKANYFLGFGTALGFYRDKDFIPQDTDIDICVLADDLDYQPLIDEFKKNYTFIREVKDNNRVYQTCYRSDDGFIIDICFYYKDGEEYYTKADGGQYRDKVEHIGKLQTLNTKYGDYSFPEKIEEYLVARYGDNWKTPKHGARGTSIKLCE